MQLKFPALPQRRWTLPGLRGQSLPPAQGKDQLLSLPALDCLLYRSLTELPYPVGRGQRQPEARWPDRGINHGEGRGAPDNPCRQMSF